jgi:enterochelin esterase-like enzyme
MIIVMPDVSVAGPDQSSRGTSAILGKEMVNDIMPFVEKNYRVLSGRDQRAIAGLSFGGGTTFNIGMRRLDLFGYMGLFSAGLFGGFGLTPSPTFGYGPYEPAVFRTFEGGHEWKVWRHSLADFAPRLFR